MLEIRASGVKKTAVTPGNLPCGGCGFSTSLVTLQSTDLHLLPFSGRDCEWGRVPKSTRERTGLSLGGRAVDRHDRLMPPSVPSSEWLLAGSRFHSVVVDRLVDGARSCLLTKGVAEASIRVVRVAGAFELPQLVAAWARPEAGWSLAGAVALGCVVRGETPHFDHVCRETLRGLLDVAIHQGLPLGLGVLTCDTLEQALARAGGDHGDKGWEAAEAAWDLARQMAAARADAPAKGEGRPHPAS
jgi:6,7-dimethyl-8-ribityllumazine synthase